MYSLISDLVSANKCPGTSIFCKDGGLSGIFQGLLRFFSSLRQSVPRASAQEYARTRVVVGHTPEMRVCPTANPSTELVRGVSVGHFGGRGESRGEREERAERERRENGERDGGKVGEKEREPGRESGRKSLKEKQRPDILVVKILCTNFTTI